jgi:hypothetical protein
MGPNFRVCSVAASSGMVVTRKTLCEKAELATAKLAMMNTDFNDKRRIA